MTSYRVSFPSAGWLGLVVFLSAYIGILTRPEGLLATFWPTNALLLGVMVRFPRLMRIESWVAAVVAYVAADLLTGSELQRSLTLTMGNMVFALTGYWLFSRLSRDDQQLHRPMAILTLFGNCALASVAAAAVGALVSARFGHTFFSSFVFWFATELSNAIIILPMVLTLPQRGWRREIAVETEGATRFDVRIWGPLAALAGLSTLGFWVGGVGALLFPVPGLLWCALSYGLFTTSIITMLACLWLMALVSMGVLGFDLSDSYLESMISIRLGITLLALGPLAAASLSRQRQRLLAQERLLIEDLKRAKENADVVEEALRASEQRWQFALEGAGDGIWDWDVLADRLDPSVQGRKLLGYAATDDFDVSLRAWELRTHPDDLPALQASFNAHIRQETPAYGLEYRLRMKDGTWRWFLIRGKIVRRSESGAPLRVTGTIVDVSERRESEEALRESEARWQFALEGAGDGVWDWNVATGKVYYSHSWKSMLGYEDHEVGDRIEDWASRVHPEDLPGAQAALKLHFETGAPYVQQLRFRTKQAGWMSIFVRGRVVERDEKDQPLRMIGTHTDLSETLSMQQRLRDSNTALLSAERLARIGHWSWKVREDEAHWSELLYDIFQLDKSRPAPKLAELATIFTPDSFAVFGRVAQECVVNGTPYSVDLEARRTDGTPCWVHARGEAVVDADGQVLEVRGTIHDITERSKMERTLKEERNLLRTLVDTLPLYVFIKDKDCVMKLVNRMAAEDMGMASPSEAEGRPVSALHGHDAEKFMADDREVMRTGVPKLEFEESIMTSVRGLRWLRTSKIPLRDSDGAVIGVMGVSFDITEAREADEKLRSERHLLRTLIDHLPQSVFIVDREDRLQIGNAALFKWMGVSGSEEIGERRFHSLMQTQGKDLWQECLRVMESGTPKLEYVEQVYRADGIGEWHRTSKLPWRDAQGRVVGLVGISMDISFERETRRRLDEKSAQLAVANRELRGALEEAEHQKTRAQISERAKSEFLAIMSHEIRTPMNTVLGMVRLALKTDLTPKQHNYLSKIDLAAKALITIINDILDFSKIEAGKMTLETAEFGVDALFESVAAVTAMKACCDSK